MNMSTQLTYPGIGIAVFAEQLCLPVPAMVLLITVGALASQGEEKLHLYLVVLSGVIGCLLADGFWFWLGRRWGSGVIRLVCSFTANPPKSRERSHRIFDKWGLRLLLVAKFVPGLDGVAPPLAGAEGATIMGFLSYDAAGSLLWNAAYVGAGFLFANQIASIMQVVDHFGRALLVLIGAPLSLYIVWRAVRLVRMIRHLRLRRISPALLQSKLEQGDNVMLVDLQHYEAQEVEVMAVPGAFRADPARLRTVKKLFVPDGIDVVLYCSSQNEFVSARVAAALQKIGIREVWVLEGGLQAWVKEGRVTTTELADGADVAKRVGISLPSDM